MEQAFDPRLTIRMFGPFEARLGDDPLTDLRLRMGDRMLAYLVLRHSRPIATESLLETFWFEQATVEGDHERAHASLRQCLRHLREALGQEADPLETSRVTVSFQVEGADIDVVTFDDACRAERDSLKALQAAVELYRGPLLEDWGERPEERWVEKERRARADSCVEALDRLAAAAAAEQNYRVAIDYLRWYVQMRPRLEAGWCRLMEALVRSGERIKAIELYRRTPDVEGRSHQLSPQGRPEHGPAGSEQAGPLSLREASGVKSNPRLLACSASTPKPGDVRG